LRARIYKPAKSAMQSGRAKTRHWVLEWEPAERKRLDPLMGWTSSGDTMGQVHLNFETLEAAIGYAERHGIEYQVQPPHEREIEPKAYADNFAYTRKSLWTH
jgi:hypothetical protein